MTVNIHEAKTKLSELIRKAEQGEEIIIARAGNPTVFLKPYTQADKRELGEFKGLITISDDFDAPLPDEILEPFYS
ncbi:MAG: type II toxin-antitoxin system prevent-host-death family antitoxin [Spirochaetes bacterium]|nr:MAG: type II toxin-antitoxin system prevent-host-death family antitoxin [Spirochaetota bacterium]